MEKRPTQTLEAEHHLIQQVVGSMAVLADRLYEGQPAEKEMLVNIVDFLRVFVEKCHHEKEENHLFPLLVKKGVPVAGCPIGILTREHQAAAKLTADLNAAVEAYLKTPREMGLPSVFGSWSDVRVAFVHVQTSPLTLSRHEIALPITPIIRNVHASERLPWMLEARVQWCVVQMWIGCAAQGKPPSGIAIFGVTAACDEWRAGSFMRGCSRHKWESRRFGLKKNAR